MNGCSQFQCWNEAVWVVRSNADENAFFWSCPSCLGSLLEPGEENVVYPIEWDLEDSKPATVIEPGEFVSTITRDVLANAEVTR